MGFNKIISITALSLLLILAGCSQQQTTNDSLFPKKQIVGIEPGAGVMKSTEEAIDSYNLSFALKESSTAAMMAEVDASIQNKEDIVFTIWEPHSAFAKFDIKKLDDPKGVYGGGDKIYTITRKGFQEDHPQVYNFLQEFQVSADTQSGWILEYSSKERDPAAVAEEWVNNNQDKVESWTEELEQGSATLKFALPPWPGVTVKTQVVKHILENRGYNVETSKLDTGILYSQLAEGNIDVLLAGWLPVTHEDYWSEHNQSLNRVTVNVNRTWLGLAVPSYTHDKGITSIEDLE